jgi:hypothetical protein
MSSWQDREGLFRREVRPYVLPDRAVATPFVPMPSAGEPRLTLADEWRTGRLAIQPSAIIAVAVAAQWPLAPDPIDEATGGTYYTNWVTFTDGPIASGLFSCPECTLTVEAGPSAETASVYLELEDVDAGTITVLVADLTADGEATRTGAGDPLFSLTSGKQLAKGRFKVVSDCGVEFSAIGQLTSYGSV